MIIFITVNKMKLNWENVPYNRGKQYNNFFYHKFVPSTMYACDDDSLQISRRQYIYSKPRDNKITISQPCSEFKLTMLFLLVIQFYYFIFLILVHCATPHFP
jgi:hypothetical protein